MTRDDLIRDMVDQQGHIPYKVMCNAVKHLFEVMVHSLQQGSRIEIRGFGSFVTRKRDPRLVRNPKTGAIVQTSQKLSVHFKPGKELKERVNSVNAVN